MDRLPATAVPIQSEPIPSEPILSNRPGSFPWSVLHDRHPALLAQVLEATPYPPERRAAIERLAEEITGVIEPLGETAVDAPDWAAGIGRSWYDVPFLWAENYFYRKLLAAVGYLEPGPWLGIDPFGPMKDAELSSLAVDQELAALEELAVLPIDQQFEALLLAALWGNRADLGFLISAEGPAARVDHLVVDDRARLARLLSEGEPGTVMLVADNAGRELLPDLVLIDHLLARGLATEVVLHVKSRPYFVSDAMTADVLAALRRLSAGPAVAVAIGDRLTAALVTGRLVIRADPFFVAPLTFHDLPEPLRAEFGAARLTIVKGDLNYRRLVGDRDWPATSSFVDLTSYFPSPVVALRTLKSDVVVGLSDATVSTLEATGEPWRTTGTQALIQLRV
jgi:hypothetical protein